MTTENGADEFAVEIADIKHDVKNINDNLHQAIKRIEELELKRHHQMHRERIALPDGDSVRHVNVEHSENTDDDGSHIKRVHVTERVVTTKTFHSAPPYHEDHAGHPNKHHPDMNNASSHTTIGYRRKKHDEHLGLTVHPENGQLVVDDIQSDSPLLKQGDYILEVNGHEVKSQDELQNQWKQAGDSVMLKIVPGRIDRILPDAKYVKAMMDYDPNEDKGLQHKDLGLSFKIGDILQVISQDDAHYWQARKVNDMSRVGLVPAKKILESRHGSTAGDERKASGFGLIKKRKINTDKDNESVIYEEVAKLSPYGRRVLVLLGAPGVGRRTIKSMLLAHDRNDFATVTPYTSRAKRDGEQEGREYHFVKRDGLHKDVEKGNMVEWGEYNGNFYGTSVQSVRDVIRSGRMCLLDCSPQAARYLYTREFMPYVVYIAPPNFEELKQLYQDDDLKRTCDESSKMEAQYKNLFDLVLVNRNVDVTFRRLLDALEALKTETQWVSAGWIY